jgi:hypothetical protein
MTLDFELVAYSILAGVVVLLAALAYVTWRRES